MTEAPKATGREQVQGAPTRRRKLMAGLAERSLFVASPAGDAFRARHPRMASIAERAIDKPLVRRRVPEQAEQEQREMLPLREQWSVYMDEINGTGFRWEFDPFTMSPDKLRATIGESHYLTSHRSDPERFRARLARFGSYVDSVEAQVGETITEPKYFPDDRTIIREIPADLIPKYRKFQEALTEYADGLDSFREGEADLGTLAELAVRIQDIVRPPRDDESEPYDEGISDSRPRWFLEAKIRQETGQTPQRFI